VREQNDRGLARRRVPRGEMDSVRGDQVHALVGDVEFAQSIPRGNDARRV